MDREALMNAWSICGAEGKDKRTGLVTPPTATGYDVELERQKLQFEMRKFEAEQTIKQAEYWSKIMPLSVKKRIRLLYVLRGLVTPLRHLLLLWVLNHLMLCYSLDTLRLSLNAMWYPVIYKLLFYSLI